MKHVYPPNAGVPAGQGPSVVTKDQFKAMLEQVKLEARQEVESEMGKTLRDQFGMLKRQHVMLEQLVAFKRLHAFKRLQAISAPREDASWLPRHSGQVRSSQICEQDFVPKPHSPRSDISVLNPERSVVHKNKIE